MSNCPDCERLRARIHEIQVAADRRNADLHKRVVYYESISRRTNELLNRFKVERGERRVIDWYADILHTEGLDQYAHPHPGSMNGFWIAFQQVLEAESTTGASEISTGLDTSRTFGTLETGEAK